MGQQRGSLAHFRKDKKSVVQDVENENIYNFYEEKISEKPNLDLIF